MGWLEGVLSGFADRHYQIEDDKRREAQLAADREGRVFETLLNSKYPEIRDYAAAGMLDLSNPRRRKGGVAGWMGEVEQTPYLDMIKRARERIGSDPEYAQSQLPDDETSGLGPAPTGGRPPTSPSIPTPAGSVPATGSAALPSTSLVNGGTGTAPTPAPPPTPPRLSATFKPGEAPQQAAAPPISFAPPPAPPRPTASGLPGGATQPVGAPPPGPPRRTQLPGIFPTATDTALDAARARAAGADLGEQDSYIRVAEAQGLTRAEGLQMWAEAQMKAKGGQGMNTPYGWRPMEYTDEQGAKHRMLARTNRVTGAIEDINGKPLPASAVPVTPGLYPAEISARRQAQNPLLWNQALSQARSVLGVNATAEEVISMADEMFTASQSMAPTTPGAAPPAPGGTPAPASTPAPAPTDTATPTPTPAPGGPPGGTPAAAVPAAAASAAPGALPPAVQLSPGALTPGEALKGGLAAGGNANLLDRRKDEGRPATAPERDVLGFYLRARQPLDAIAKRDPKTGLSLEDRIAQQSLGAQFQRRLTPDALDFTLGADAQLYKTAAERFTEARVRKVSGAQIRPDEYETDRQMFFAQPGDTPERIAEKQRQREAELDAVVFAAGPAYQEYFKKPYTPTVWQDPTAISRLPAPLQPPPPNRSVPRGPGGPPAPPGAAATSGAAATPTGTPTSEFRDGKWYIVYR